MWCLMSSSRAVLERSAALSSESLKQWMKSSPLVGSTLGQFQWYHDKDWEAARTLAEQNRTQGARGTNRKGVEGSGINLNSTRQYSTSRDNKDNVCK